MPMLVLLLNEMANNLHCSRMRNGISKRSGKRYLGRGKTVPQSIPFTQ